MKAGDIVYLKSGSPPMTVIREVEGGWLLHWFGGSVLYTGVFAPEALRTDNPEPEMTDELRKKREALAAVAAVEAEAVKA